MADTDPPWIKDVKKEMARENRIEALRAASRMVSGTYSEASRQWDEAMVRDFPSDKVTLWVADQFLRWLEGGDG